MTTFNLYDAAGTGFNMPSTTGAGVIFGSGSTITVTGVPFDDGSTAILAVSGSPTFNFVGINYSIVGDTFFLFDVIYFKNTTTILEIFDWNLVGSISDLSTGSFFIAEINTLDDTFTGNNFSDVIHGGPGHDDIFGWGGNDFLFGDVGDDLLVGGLGKDQLAGGTGFDVFAFDHKLETPKGAARDIIWDFDPLFDFVDLSLMDASTKKSGNQKFKFIGNQAFHKKAGELHYVKKPGYVILEGDIDGNGKADFQIEVHGITKLFPIDIFL